MALADDLDKLGKWITLLTWMVAGLGGLVAILLLLRILRMVI